MSFYNHKIAVKVFLFVVLLISPQFALPRFGSLPVINVTRAFYICILISYLLRLKNYNKTLFNFPLKKNVKLFILLIGISSFLGLNTFKSFFGFCLDFFEIFILFFIVSNSISSHIEAHNILKKLSFLFVLICIYGIYSYYSETNLYIDFITKYGNTDDITLKVVQNSDRGLKQQANSIFYHSVEFAAMICIFLPALFYTYGSKIKINVINMFYLILPFFVAFLTGSRSVIISSTIFIILFFFSIRLKQKIRLIPLLFSGILIIFFNFSTLLNITFNSNVLSSTVQGSSYDMRLVQLFETLRIFYDNILYGHGYKYVSEIMGQYAYRNLNGFESIFFQVLINHGLLGLIAYVILFAGLFKFYFDQKAYVFLYGAISYLCFIVLTGPMTSFPLFIILNTLFIITLKNKNFVHQKKSN